MKKLIVLLLCVAIFLPGVVQGAEERVLVTIPSFDVSVAGTGINTVRSQYPVITYKDVTYFPMTSDYLAGIGLNLSFGQEVGLSLEVEGYASPLEQAFLAGYNELGSEHMAQLVPFPVEVNGVMIDNATEEYPVLLFRDITYFPMTWRFAVEEFGWSTAWSDETGFEITPFDKVEANEIILKEVESSIVGGRIVDEIDYRFIDDPMLVGEWKSIGFVDKITDYNGFVENYNLELYLDSMNFYASGNTDGPWEWTEGLITHEGDNTASRYLIEEVNGETYLFMEWKSGDYTIRHSDPKYYVFTRAENIK